MEPRKPEERNLKKEKRDRTGFLSLKKQKKINSTKVRILEKE